MSQVGTFLAYAYGSGWTCYRRCPRRMYELCCVPSCRCHS